MRGIGGGLLVDDEQPRVDGGAMLRISSVSGASSMIRDLSPPAGRTFSQAASPISTRLVFSAAQVFDETLAILFNAAGGGALHVENLKGATGEIALRVGDNEPFGVINVGDDAKLVKLCEDNGIATQDSEFAGSLFHAINTPQSTVNLLIGSKSLPKAGTVGA